MKNVRKIWEVMLLLLLCLLFAAVVPAAQMSEGKPNMNPMKPGQTEESEPVETYTVVFHKANGKVLKTLEVKKGEELEMIQLADTKTATMMGWSTEQGQTLNPKYLIGQIMTPKGDLELYPVLYPREAEQDRTDALFGAQKTVYQNIIFVGDSRTRFMSMDLKQMDEEKKEAVLGNVYFVCKGGSRFGWLEASAWGILVDLLKECEGKTAVVFNHGVNDLSHINKYINFYVEKEKVLKKYNADGYIMSVNPNNRLMELNTDIVPDRIEKNVLLFNEKIRNRLCAKTGYRYIDTFHFLMRNGYTFNDGSDRLGSRSYNDGVHYSAKTGRRIFLYAMRALRTVADEA